MDPALLPQVDARVSAVLPLLSGMVVIRGGEIVFEHYSGQTADVPIDVWSATKSVTNMAVGLAVADGLLQLDQTVGELIPGRIPAGADPRTATVTVEQLLTMTGGWAWDSTMPSHDFLHFDDAPDWAFINAMVTKYLGQDRYPFGKPGDEWVVVVIRPERTTQMG